MALFECHITVPIDYMHKDNMMWKSTFFDNYSTVKNELILVDSEQIITSEMREHSDYNAALLFFMNYFEKLKFFTKPIRFKIETPLEKRFGKSLYFESHYKIKNIASQKHLIKIFPLLFSLNNKKHSWWCSLRNDSMYQLKDMHHTIMNDYHDYFIETEIESVILDTNIEKDYKWMGLS